MSEKYPLRILHVVGAMNAAGTETMLMNIYRKIDRDRVQFDFISYQQNSYYDEEIKRMGGRIIRLSNTLSVKEIYDAINRYGPYKAVHSHTFFHCGIANLAARLAGIKIRVAHAHTNLDRCDTFARKIYCKSMRFAIRLFSTNLLACSEGAGRYLFGDRCLAKARFTYFPNLIDYPKFLQVPDEEVRNLKAREGLQDMIVIGHIGRFIEAKNHAFIVEILECILKKNNSIKLLLVGDGDLRADIENMARTKSIFDSIGFLGVRDDIPVLLHCMDVFVFPSLHEGLGLVLLEAQACGVPCIVSEAIQPEADLGIGLLFKLSLNAGASVWADKILEQAKKKEKDIDKISNSFDENEYSLPQGICKLMDIYNVALEDV